MKHSTATFLLLFGALIFWAACQRSKDDIPGLAVTFRDGVLYSENVAKFGHKVLIRDQDLLVTDLYNVYWFVEDAEEWKARQIISAPPEKGQLVQIDLDRNTLCLGYSLGDFTSSGQVVIYELVSGRWKEVQQLHGIEANDAFGWVLDLDGDNMIVKAHTAWSDSTDINAIKGAGGVQFFRRTAGIWMPVGHFQAEEPKGGDHFGNILALEGNYAFVGSSTMDGLYVYAFDGRNWTFKQKWPGIRATKVAVHNGNMIIREEAYYNEPQLLSFRVENGEIVDTYAFDFGLHYGTDVDLKVYRDWALSPAFVTNAGDQLDGVVWLLRLVNGVWTKVRAYTVAEAYPGRFGGSLALSDDWVVISADLQKKVFFYPLP